MLGTYVENVGLAPVISVDAIRLLPFPEPDRPGAHAPTWALFGQELVLRIFHYAVRSVAGGHRRAPKAC